MPSQNMLPKGQRRRTVRPEYVATRFAEEEAPPAISTVELEESENDLRTFTAAAEAAGLRIDHYLAHAIPDLSRARVQLLIEAGQVRIDGLIPKSKARLKGGETIEIEGEPHPEPLHATPEDIPLTILFEDQYLAIIDKPAGMMVHAGAGSPEANAGTLVNALLFHLGKLSETSGELRPGIVHRLDKQTSGAIVVAKDDLTHRKLGELFSQREVQKTYIALAHGHLSKDLTTVNLPIARDLVRRIRMTTRRADGRSAVSHFEVKQRLDTPYGPFTLLEARIETGRTHQIRVHLQSLGHPVVGDYLYGAPHVVKPLEPTRDPLELPRNFLHAARLAFTHPRTGKPLALESPLPAELTAFLDQLRS